MKIKISREVKIGIYALTTLVIMYWVFNFIKGRDIFSSYDNYYVAYENVEGLGQTSSIYLKGLKVGNVSKISLEKSGQFFEATLRIHRGYSIPENSTAEIYSTDIMGNKAVRVIVGDSPRLAKPGDFLNASVASDFTNMMSKELLPLKDKLEVLMTNLNTTVVSLNNVLTENTQKQLAESIRHLNTSLQNISTISSTLNNEKEHIARSLENIDSFTASLSNNTQNINAIISNLEQLSDSLKYVDIKSTFNHLNTLLAQASDTTGTVGQLLYNNEIHHRLSATLNDLDLLIKDLKENPKKYVKLSLF